MKALLYIAIFLAVALFTGCTKAADTDIAQNGSLVGKWILIETLADPGDGSGKWTPVNPPNVDYIQFKEDGSIESNVSGRFSRLKKYSVINDSTLHFEYGIGDKVMLYYKLVGKTLTISGGCIEACGSKFIKSGA